MHSLAWILVDGTPQHVSAFSHLPPRLRPRATCPLCTRRVTLKLGQVRRYHAAHAHGDTCAATRPETALHLNTKLALAAALRTATGTDATVRLLRTCVGAGGDLCNEMSIVDWIHDWDDVLVEYNIGDGQFRRPDIVLMRGAKAIGAIEVVVSNVVSRDKAAVLAALDVSWIEVSADEKLATADGWSPASPLPVARTNDGGAWRCAVHAARHRILIDAAEARRATEREAGRHSSDVRAARVVDIYHPDGARERLIYSVATLAIDGRAHSARLRRGGGDVLTVPIAADADWSTSVWPALRAAFAGDLQRFARDAESFTDSPMRWATGGAALNIVEEALSDRVGRDPTPLATTFPRRWFFARQQRRWFLAPELRDIRWDRAPLDPFAAHPAWAKARGSVRERPAPEGSWDTPVFASRPLGVMFHPLPDAITLDEGGTVSLVSIETVGVRAAARRLIVVIERATSAETLSRLMTELSVRGEDPIWMSHPLDWNDALSQVPWVLAGRDARGRGGVIVDGLGLFTARQFVRAVARGDARLSADAIRAGMAGRVARFVGSRTV